MRWINGVNGVDKEEAGPMGGRIDDTLVATDVLVLWVAALHYGRLQPRIQTAVLGHSLVRLLVRSHRSLIRLLRFAYSAALTRSLARSLRSLPCSSQNDLVLSHSVVGRSASWKRESKVTKRPNGKDKRENWSKTKKTQLSLLCFLGFYFLSTIYVSLFFFQLFS